MYGYLANRFVVLSSRSGLYSKVMDSLSFETVVI